MNTKVLKVDADNIDPAKIKEAAAIIDSGGLVAFPTETVYGIACRVGSGSLARLNGIKGRPDEKHYTLHVARKGDIDKYVPHVGMRGRKLIEYALPGPLTIVFDLNENEILNQRKSMPTEVFENLYKGNTIGIRCPDHPVAQVLLHETGNPVVAPSANQLNQSPAVNGEQALDKLDGQIEIVLDAGSCKYKMSSTVVKIGDKEVVVLREGVFSRDEIKKMAEIKFLFVCTGNTCRSPMAEGVFRKYLAEKLQCNVDELDKMGYKIVSAGVAGLTGSPASASAVRACASRNVDISLHRSQGLTKRAIEESDFIFAMERLHVSSILSMDADAGGKTLLLSGNQEIPDPVGQSQEVYDHCAGIIERAVINRISELKI